MATLVDGHWLAVRRADPRAFGLFRRHYSAQKNWRWRRRGNTEIAGPGEVLTLLTEPCDALFVWTRNTIPRLDGQSGVNCAVFRNEGPTLSSELIREADALGWQRWPTEPRHFTYIDAGHIRHKRDPGRCFRKAGWRVCGRSDTGKLLMEIVA